MRSSSEKTRAPRRGAAQGQARPARTPARARTLHEPARARRLDELVAEGGVELAQRRHDDRRLSAIGPVLERSLCLSKVDLRAVGRIGVDLEGEGHVLPLTQKAHACAPDAEPVLVLEGPALRKLILGVLMRLVLALHVGAIRDPVGRSDPRPERLLAERCRRGRGGVGGCLGVGVGVAEADSTLTAARGPRRAGRGPRSIRVDGAGAARLGRGWRGQPRRCGRSAVGKAGAAERGAGGALGRASPARRQCPARKTANGHGERPAAERPVRKVRLIPFTERTRARAGPPTPARAFRMRYKVGRGLGTPASAFLYGPSQLNGEQVL